MNSLVTEPDISERCDEVVRPFVNSGEFMGCVLVARRDKVLFSRGYGSANLEWNIPNTPEARFRIASVTKQFTAAAILLLADRGKLDLDAAVANYVPDSPPAWEKVTPFHLLTHTAGLANYTSFPEYQSRAPFPASPEEIIATFRDRPLEFEPGTKHSYTNSGYVVLGYLIERLGGRSYAQFLAENIFAPLGMENSGYDSSAPILLRRAAGYSPSPDGPRNAEFLHMSLPYAAGAIYSTTADLLKWQLGLYGGKLLLPASLARMTTPFKDNYAFGLVVKSNPTHYWHNGGIQGFSASMVWYPDSQVSAIVLANLTGWAADQMVFPLARIAI